MGKPNIIVFITDDQGYGDLSCMGATDFSTPHLDQLAKDGVRFTDFYANSPVCSPSRAAMLTGRYPGYAGVRAILSGRRKATGLTPEMPTIPSVLRENGYQTAMYGKWHLGHTPESRPDSMGFDEWFGFLAGCIDYYSHIFYWEMNMEPVKTQLHDLWHNGEEIWRNGEYFTDMVTEGAVKYVRDAAKSDNPFFLYVPYNAPHYPMHAPEKYMDRFAHLPWDRQVMAAMISSVDDGVGDIITELKRQGIYEDTIIFFMSDNGPSREARNWLDGSLDPYYGGTAGKLKGHKASLYDGGIRVPAIISWAGHIPGGQVLNEPVAAMDLLPTLLDLLDIGAGSYGFDGNSWKSLLMEGAGNVHEAIFWEMLDQTAVRKGSWKLVLNGRLVEDAPPEDDVHLANLDIDMAEQNNLHEQHPELVEELKSMALSWRTEMEAHWNKHFEERMRGPMIFPD